MSPTVLHPHFADDPELVAEILALVQKWLADASTLERDKAGERLAGVLKDPKGLPFTVGFVDGVIRPEDRSVAAAALAGLTAEVPDFLPWWMRAGLHVAAAAGRPLPGLVIPVVRRALRQLVQHLIIDASDKRLGHAIAELRRDGTRLNLNLLGEAVYGQQEADRRLEGTTRLLARPDVDYVSIKVSAAVAPHSPWAFDAAVADVVARLTPLYELAAASPTPKFINLDMEEYHDLDLTVAVFTALLSRPALVGLEAGIVLQAYLPDAMAAMIHLQEWAAARRADGGAGIKVRLVKGANLPMERVEAALHDWPLATWSSKQQTDTHYKRIIDYALVPERITNVRLGVAGHNLFDLAFAWTLAGRRGVRDGIEFEMLLGMAQEQAEAVKRDVGTLLLYTPVVHPQEFDVAIAYLIRRLEEGASQENFMSAVFDLNDDASLYEREKTRFLASLAEVDLVVPEPHRTQDRRNPVDDAAAPGPFRNVPDTDPSLAGNRAWAAELLAAVPGSRLGVDLVEQTTIRTETELETMITGAVAAQLGWADLGGRGRAETLRRVAVELERSRADLVAVMAAECGKTVDQADPEVSEAIDFANYYAASAEELDSVDGAEPVPSRLTVVTPPWNFPVAIPAGSTLAALAAGSAVVIKPAPPAQRCGAVMIDILWRAGVPTDVLRLVQVDEGDLGARLLSDPRVDRVILTGAYETAELFRSFRADLPLLAETSGKNAIIVTPSADFDLAARDVVSSAFGHAGQKCSAASLVILVGSVASSRRFRDQLLDAVGSLTVGLPSDPTSQMGPLTEPAAGKLLDALTTLQPGERWLVRPRRLDEVDRLWTPGVKEGVAPGSAFHLTECFGPVLGIMTAATLDEAIAMQNAVDYGLTAGLHSLDADELATWLDRVQAGNLYVNRGITGAIVGRQPFGGWKRSGVGAGTKAGGPSYLVGLSGWRRRPSTALDEPLPLRGTVTRLLDAAERAGLCADDLAFLRRSARTDAAARREIFGAPYELAGIDAERNVFRHLPTEVAIRAAAGAQLADLIRVVSAAVLAQAPVTVSVADPLPEALQVVVAAVAPVTVESDQEWAVGLRYRPAGRIRLLGATHAVVTAASGGRPDLAVYDHPVTEAGRIELLPFLREQSISITNHRFGNPTRLSEGLLASAAPDPVSVRPRALPRGSTEGGR